jgi:hypothetical protein
VRPLGANAEVGAHGSDTVVIAPGRAGFPAVANLLVLVKQREVFALVGLRLDAADLVRPFGPWSRRSGPAPPTAGGCSSRRNLDARLRRSTPIATVLAHVAYEVIVGGFASLAG